MLRTIEKNIKVWIRIIQIVLLPVSKFYLSYAICWVVVQFTTQGNREPLLLFAPLMNNIKKLQINFNKRQYTKVHLLRMIHRIHMTIMEE